MVLIDKYYRCKNRVDLISTRRDNVATSTMDILRKTQKLKNITIPYFTTIFHNFALKIETGRATRMVKPILKTGNKNDNAC